MIGEISQSLNTSGGGTSTDGDEFFALGSQFRDAMFVLVGADGAFDDCQIVGAWLQVAGGFCKVSKRDLIRDAQEFIFAVQEGQLAAVAGGEFHDRDGRLFQGFAYFFLSFSHA